MPGDDVIKDLEGSSRAITITELIDTSLAKSVQTDHFGLQRHRDRHREEM